MKLNFLPAGRLRMKKSIYVSGADRSETIDLPVSSALIRHKQGNVLFDTGCHPSVVDHAEARWGTLAKVMTPLMNASETLLPSLACQRGARVARYLVRRHAEMQAQCILRVEVDGEDVLAGHGQGFGEVGRQRGLAHAALARGDGDDPQRGA